MLARCLFKTTPGGVTLQEGVARDMGTGGNKSCNKRGHHGTVPRGLAQAMIHLVT